MKDETKTTTIKEAHGFPKGTPIQRITGKIGLVWDRTTGEGKWGTWFKQSGLMDDGQGNKIVFTVWDKPDISEYKGRTVIFRALPGKKPTITLNPDFKDPTKMSLNVSKTALMLTEEEDTDDIPMDYSNEPEMVAGQVPQKPQQNPPKVNVATNGAVTGDGVEKTRHRLMQRANLYKLCYGAAKHSANGNGLDPQYVKDISTAFFIGMEREGFVDKMPHDHPIDDKRSLSSRVIQDPEPEIAPEDIVF